jgi:transposase
MVTKTKRVGGLTMPVFASASQMAQGLAENNIKVSKTTVWRDLRLQGFRSFVRKRVPSRNAEVLKKKRAFMKEWAKQSPYTCRKLVFSDEHTVSINDHTTSRMYAKSLSEVVPRERCRLQNIPRRMVWAAVGIRYKSEIVVFPPRHRMNGDDYVRKCLSKVSPDLVRTQALYIQDNARPHVTSQVTGYLRRKGIQKVDFPPYAPELNMIEYVWPLLNQEVAKLGPKSDEELVNAIKAAWNTIPQSKIDKFCGYFPKKIKELLEQSRH